MANAMDALPETVLSAVLAFSDCATLLAAESTSRHLRYVARVQGVWETLARRGVTVSENDEPVSPLEWKLLALLSTRQVTRSNSLLDHVTGCSTVDHPEESPVNTLTPSPCWMSIQSIQEPLACESVALHYLEIGRDAQIDCRCPDAIPCYWSSTPSTDPNIHDFIDYTVVPRSLVHLVEVIPYRAFWHPRNPTYGPLAISFQFYSMRSAAAATSSEKEVLYESPVFPLKNSMQSNEFALPKPLWLPTGAIMRLNLLGRHQSQTVETDPRIYYACISHVSAQGVLSEARAVPLLPHLDLPIASVITREEDGEELDPPTRKRRHDY